MAKIINGQQIAESIHKSSADQIQKLKKKPQLAVFLVGHNVASARYVAKKQEAANKIGMQCKIHHFDMQISENDLISQIQEIQTAQNPNGCIVQLPLPAHLNTQNVLNAISPDKDVDCLTQTNMGKLVSGVSPFVPPTVAAILYILENEEKLDLREKHVVIVGAGILVGKPLTMLMLQREATVTVCNKYTQNLGNQTRDADVLVTAVGQKDLIKADMIKDGAVVIDVGVSFEGAKIYGDAEFEKVKEKAQSITPTPGGVGPITVAMLLANTVKASTQP